MRMIIFAVLVAAAAGFGFAADQANACTLKILCGVEGMKLPGTPDPVKSKRHKQRFDGGSCVLHKINRSRSFRQLAVTVPSGAIEKCAAQNRRIGLHFSSCPKCLNWALSMAPRSPGAMFQRTRSTFGNPKVYAATVNGSVQGVYLPAGAHPYAGWCEPSRNDMAFANFG